jgi:hypothetical protein
LRGRSQFWPNTVLTAVAALALKRFDTSRFADKRLLLTWNRFDTRKLS